MLGKAMLEALLAYDVWATDKLLAQAAGLTAEELDAPTQYGRGSIRAILFHATGAFDVWQHVLAHGSYPATWRRLEACVTVDDLAAYHQSTIEAARAALAMFSEEELAEEITVPDPRGNPRALQRWWMLAQPLTHAMQHRAEVAAELTRVGRSPGDLDFVFYAMARGQAAG
jgi:uncharacterized damage-inducible protein DinB